MKSVPADNRELLFAGVDVLYLYVPWQVKQRVYNTFKFKDDAFLLFVFTK